MNKYFLDTNFIFALLFENDALHEEALERFIEIQEMDLFTSSANVAELLSSGENMPFITVLVELEIEIIDVTLRELEFIHDSIPANIRRKVKAIDSIVLALSLMNEGRLITYDRALAKTYEKLMSSINPFKLNES